MKYIEERMAKIEKRNALVEMNKAWEVSWTRRLTIMILTYIVVVLILSRIHYEGALLDALIPSFGYLLSTLTLPPLKNYWIKQKVASDASEKREGADGEDLDEDRIVEDETIAN